MDKIESLKVAPHKYGQQTFDRENGARMSLDTDLIPFTKINSKWITELNVKHKTVKLPEVNGGENID